jgi:hypothetical protein
VKLIKYIVCLNNININTRFVIEQIIAIALQKIVKPKKKE